MTASPPIWSATQPLESATTLPATLYHDPAIAALERQAIFSRSWQLVGHASQVAGIGDHLITDIAGVPIVVVRGNDGKLRALHNVCRHRAGPLVLANGCGATALRCRYHGWMYTLEGQLRSATEMADAADFNIADVRLPEAQVAVWQNLVFVALDPGVPLADLFDGIDERTRGHALGDLIFHSSIHYDIACNWKAYVDNYLEGYHLPHIHPALNRLLDYRSYSTTIAHWHSLQHSPLENAESFYGSGEALYYFIWPNTMLNILPGRMQTNRVIPLDSNRCRVEFCYFYPVDTGDDARRNQDQVFSDEVQREDVAICEQVQRRLESGSYVAGRLNPLREGGVHHFQELIRRVFRERATRG